MSYEFKSFTKDDTHLLFQTFLSAFSDYVQDVSHVSEVNFVNRFTRGGVSYESSVGAFYEGELVGFTMVALDNFYGSPSAFDAMTGIIKDHRGKGLAKTIFQHAVPGLKEKGVKTFYLEVIQENEPAVRAYEKTGFTVNRELDSFALKFDNAKLDGKSNLELDIRQIDKSELAPSAAFFDWPPAWENSLSSIQRVPDAVTCLGAFHQGQLVGTLVHHPASNWLFSLGVHKSFRRHKIGTALLAALRDRLIPDFSDIKLVNIDHGDASTLQFLEAIGAEYLLNQFEMKMDL